MFIKNEVFFPCVYYILLYQVLVQKVNDFQL